MSVVIIGGHERMVRQYEEICEKHGCDAKVFVKERSGFKKNLGTPDLMILLTNTVSHKMVKSAVSEARRNKIQIARAHSSSASALTNVLRQHGAGPIDNKHTWRKRPPYQNMIRWPLPRIHREMYGCNYLHQGLGFFIVYAFPKPHTGKVQVLQLRHRPP